jgi:hypothetical protein
MLTVIASQLVVLGHAMDAGLQSSACAVLVPMTWPFHRTERCDLLGVNEAHVGRYGS